MTKNTSPAYLEMKRQMKKLPPPTESEFDTFIEIFSGSGEHIDEILRKKGDDK